MEMLKKTSVLALQVIGFEDSKVKKILTQRYLAFGDISRMHRNNAQLPFERLTSKMTKGGPHPRSVALVLP